MMEGGVLLIGPGETLTQIQQKRKNDRWVTMSQGHHVNAHLAKAQQESSSGKI